MSADDIDYGNDFGWDYTLEDQHEEEFESYTLPAICETAADATIPDVVDPEWFIQDLQYYWPFCHAHMRTGMEEILAWYRTGKIFQFSRRLASVLDMRQDGNDTRPAGASIRGSILAGIKWGTCLESDYPYFPNVPPNQFSRVYTNKIPADIMEKASHRHMVSVSPVIRTYDDLDKWNITGRAVIGFGCDWTTGCDSLTGLTACQKIPLGQVRGGHALMVAGWRTYNGVRWPICHNSQTDKWGVRRRCALAPEVWNKWLKNSRYGAWAVTDIAMDDPMPQPRPWDWLKKANFSATDALKFRIGTNKT